jgi:hypothetical protein
VPADYIVPKFKAVIYIREIFLSREWGVGNGEWGMGSGRIINYDSLNILRVPLLYIKFLDISGETMRIWLACILVLFAVAELFDWMKQLALPLPIYILGGAFLAVASNYDKIVGSYFDNVTSVTPEISSIASQVDLSLSPSSDSVPLALPHSEKVAE